MLASTSQGLFCEPRRKAGIGRRCRPAASQAFLGDIPKRSQHFSTGICAVPNSPISAKKVFIASRPSQVRQWALKMHRFGRVSCWVHRLTAAARQALPAARKVKHMPRIARVGPGVWKVPPHCCASSTRGVLIIVIGGSRSGRERFDATRGRGRVQMPANAAGQREGIEARGRHAWMRFQLPALVAVAGRGEGLLGCGLGHVGAETKRPAQGGPEHGGGG